MPLFDTVFELQQVRWDEMSDINIETHLTVACTAHAKYSSLHADSRHGVGYRNHAAFVVLLYGCVSVI